MKLFSHLPKLFAAVALLWVSVFAGCAEFSRVMNMQNCNYSYKSVDNLTVSGINVSDGISATEKIKAAALVAQLAGSATSSDSLSSLGQIMSAVSGGTSKSNVPLSMTVNVKVQNPSAAEAGFSGMGYKLNVDNIDITEGMLDKSFSVAAGATETLPIPISCDLSTLLTGKTKDATVNLVKNILGVGTEASKVTANLKPVFNIGGSSVASPTYFPVSFSLGGSSK